MSFDTSFSPNVFSTRSLFKRCVKCETAAPACPACDEGSTCTMISQSCDQCATTKCIKTSSGSSSGSNGDSSDGGGDPGAIAGGVIGGVAFVAIIVGLVWWFFIRKKRNEYSLGATTDGQEKRRTNAQQSRKSTGSIASTVLTRASNVIQIAYIPGVTNRSPPDTPSSLIPPVPPLPGAAPDQHFFMPGDLRDSSFTDMSNDRRSAAPSVSPSLRSSVAASTYRSNAIVSPVPAQQATMTRAAVVSIHGNQPETQAAAITPPDAPAVPAITPAQLAKAGVADANNASNNDNKNNNNNSSIVARTMMAKPVMVKTFGGKKTNASPAVQTIEEQSESNSSAPVSRSASAMQQADPGASGFDASSDEEDEDDGIRSTKGSTKRTQSKTPTVLEDSPAVGGGPFSDQPTPDPQTRTSAHLETNDGSASNRSSHRSNRAPPPRVESPFSDANEVK